MKNLLRTTQILFALTLAMASGCDDPAEVFGDGEVSLRPSGGGIGRGILFNTNWIGKYALSELDANFGVEHNGATLVGVTLLKYGKLDGVFVDKGRVYGDVLNEIVDDKAFMGSTWHLQVEMKGISTDVTMTITDIQSVGENMVYTFQHIYSGGPKVMVPSCDEDLDSPGMQFGAILTGDIEVDAKKGAVHSRPDTIYIGCLSGGVGKAAKWGYPLHEVGLEAFEAAIRMVRADYCGTGDSFTVPGNPVDIKDKWGYRDFVVPGKTEAMWGESGAQCIATPRHTAAFPDAESVQKRCDQLGGHIPAVCKGSYTLDTLGSMFWTKNP